MLSIIWTSWKKVSSESSCKGSHDEEEFTNGNSNAAIDHIKPIFYLDDQMIQYSSSYNHQDHDHQNHSYLFLNLCHLCHRPLSLDKKVYMYRGDVGFCGEECRNRQIYLDEMKKIEISTKRILASFHQRRQGGGGRPCETSKLLEYIPPSMMYPK